MSSRSKRRRKQRRAAERAGLIVKVIKNENQNVNNPNPNAAPKGESPELGWQEKIKKFLGMGAVITFVLGVLSITANGFFNFFSDRPAVQLMPFSVTVCCLVFYVTHKNVMDHRKSKKWYVLPSVICVLVIAFSAWAVNLKKLQQFRESAGQRQEQQNMAKIADVLPVFTNITIPAVALDVLAEKLQLTSNQLSQVTSQRDALNDKLIAAQSATEPRTITANQRKNFITYLQSDFVSKMEIKVIIGNCDGETEFFSKQFREMLNAAGYGEGSPQKPFPPKENFLSELSP